MTIRTLLVDDEPLAVQGLELRLKPFQDIEIVGRAMNGREAIRAIRTEKPDLVFLDVQMPGFDGFSVVSALADITPPLFVFVTAPVSANLMAQAALHMRLASQAPVPRDAVPERRAADR